MLESEVLKLEFRDLNFGADQTFMGTVSTTYSVYIVVFCKLICKIGKIIVLPYNVIMKIKLYDTFEMDSKQPGSG